eukprot:Platyproteum_vivax@DN12411_c0_g1_i1.p2
MEQEEDSFQIKFFPKQRLLQSNFKHAQDVSVDLVVEFPNLYPLAACQPLPSEDTILPRKKALAWRVGLLEALQRRGPVSALAFWCQNLQLFFQGMEECPICYTVAHAQHRTLPRQACPTCKHKFHSECIFKWFRTSHKATCPLCQAPF